MLRSEYERNAERWGWLIWKSAVSTLDVWTHPETGVEYGIHGNGKLIRGLSLDFVPKHACFYTRPTRLVRALDEGRAALFEGPCVTKTRPSSWRLSIRAPSRTPLRFLVGWGDRLRLIEATDTDPPGIHPHDFALALPPSREEADEAEIFAPANPETWNPKPWIVWWGPYVGFTMIMPRRLES